MLKRDRVVVSKLWITGIDCDLGCFIQRLLQTYEQLPRLSFQQQWVGSGAASLSAAYVRQMRLSAEKRFMPHVCLRNPCFCGNLSLHSLPEAWGPWERQHTPPPYYGCIMLAKDRFVVSKLWITGIDCDLGCFIQRLLQVNDQLRRLSF